MKGIFKTGIIIRKCEGCGRDIDVTNDEDRKFCYSCQLLETRTSIKTSESAKHV